MNRRRALVLAGAGLIAGVAGTTWGWRHRERWIVRIVRTRLSYLTIAEAELLAFARDYTLHVRADRRRLLEVADRLGPLHGALRSLGRGAELDALEAHVCETFLLSSDFFWQGARPEVPVRFVALYDPPVSGCRNPFAKFEPEET